MDGLCRMKAHPLYLPPKSIDLHSLCIWGLNNNTLLSSPIYSEHGVRCTSGRGRRLLVDAIEQLLCASALVKRMSTFAQMFHGIFDRCGRVFASKSTMSLVASYPVLLPVASKESQHPLAVWDVFWKFQQFSNVCGDLWKALFSQLSSASSKDLLAGEKR